MKRISLVSIAILTSFGLGFAFHAMLEKSTRLSTAKKVTGIGGIFFKSKDPKTLREWYRANLGLSVNQYGSVFEWRQGADTTKKGFTQWSPFKEKTTYFEPSTKDFMINYRVEDLNGLIAQLRKDNVNILDTIQHYEYGKFVHIMDLEGNKIELWEPDDIEFEKLGIKIGATTTK